MANSQKLEEVYDFSWSLGGKELIRISSAKNKPLVPALQKAKGTPGVLNPLPADPKSKEGSCWAAHTQAPRKISQQGRATSGHQSGRQSWSRKNTLPLLFPRHQCLDSCIYSWPTRWHWQKNFAPSFFLSLCLSWSPGLPLAPDWFRGGLPPTENTVSVSHIAESPSPPVPKIPNQLDLAERWSMRHTAAGSLFSVTRAQGFQPRTVFPIT